MSTLTVQYFAPKTGSQSGYLGGGFITSGPIKTRFNVRASTKNKYGIWVTLPSHKDANGQFINDVDFVNREASEQIEQLVIAEMRKQGVNVATPVAAFVNNPAPTQDVQPTQTTTTAVTRRPPTGGIPTTPPF